MDLIWSVFQCVMCWRPHHLSVAAAAPSLPSKRPVSFTGDVCSSICISNREQGVDSTQEIQPNHLWTHSYTLFLYLCKSSVLLKTPPDARSKSSGVTNQSCWRQTTRFVLNPSACLLLPSGDELHSGLSAYHHKRWREVLLADGCAAWQDFTRCVLFSFSK